MTPYKPGIYGDRFFNSPTEAAIQYQYEARRRAENSRDIERFGALLCADMQRDAAQLYAFAREAYASI